MLIKIALFLELFRFLQFVVKQDKTCLCSSSSQLHSPRGGEHCSRLPWLVCALDQNRHAACRLHFHLLSSFVTVCSAGRDIAKNVNADKGMEVCRHGRVRHFVSAILCSSLRSSFEQFLYYGSKALGVVEALSRRSEVKTPKPYAGSLVAWSLLREFKIRLFFYFLRSLILKPITDCSTFYQQSI